MHRDHGGGRIRSALPGALGGEAVDLWLVSRGELTSAVFSLRNLASGNRITLRHAGRKQERRFDDLPPEGVGLQLQIEPRQPTRIRHDEAGAIDYYRVRLTTRLGEKPKWRLAASTDDALGVAVAVLGDRPFVDRDLYHVEWLACAAPPAVVPEEDFQAVVRLRNRSRYPWPYQGSARVRLSYHWLDAGGQRISFGGLRTELPATVGPEQELASWLAVQAPDRPGRYLLEVDPVFENVAWFSTRDSDATCPVEIEVVPTAG